MSDKKVILWENIRKSRGLNAYETALCQDIFSDTYGQLEADATMIRKILASTQEANTRLWDRCKATEAKNKRLTLQRDLMLETLDHEAVYGPEDSPFGPTCSEPEDCLKCQVYALETDEEKK